MRKLVEEFKTGEQGERESEAAEALEETNLPLTHVFLQGGEIGRDKDENTLG